MVAWLEVNATETESEAQLYGANRGEPLYLLPYGTSGRIKL